jgi:hypothetical protein
MTYVSLRPPCAPFARKHSISSEPLVWGLPFGDLHSPQNGVIEQD